MLVGHDGGRVGVDEHDIDAFIAQHAAGLGAGVVKLGRLTNDNRTGADHEHFPDGIILRHAHWPPFWLPSYA